MAVTTIPAWRLVSAPPDTHLRLFDDQVFTWDDWTRHRNAAWRHRMEPIVFMRVAVGFIWQLIYVVLAAVIVGLYQTLAVPAGAPGVTAAMATPFSAITFALSLLLVFKTNSSYARWWEGRIIWGQIVNYGRNLPRQLLSYAPAPEEWTPAQQDIINTALRWMAAAPHVTRGHLTEAFALRCEEEANHLLSDKERDYLRRHWSNRPLGVAHVLSWLCGHRVLGLTPYQQVALEEQITSLVNCTGGCERIQRTAIPAAYTRHTSRMLVIYVTLSPLMLWTATGWATPLVAPLIAFLLLGTENIGVMIEEPFHVLPLTAICRGIENGVIDIAAANQLSLQPPPATTTGPSPRFSDGSRGSRAPGSIEPRALGSFGESVNGPKGSPTTTLVTMLGLEHHPELLPYPGRATGSVTSQSKAADQQGADHALVRLNHQLEYAPSVTRLSHNSINTQGELDARVGGAGDASGTATLSAAVHEGRTWVGAAEQGNSAAHGARSTGLPGGQQSSDGVQGPGEIVGSNYVGSIDGGHDRGSRGAVEKATGHVHDVPLGVSETPRALTPPGQTPGDGSSGHEESPLLRLR